MRRKISSSNESLFYRTLSIVILMKNAPFFFKTFICNQCFGKYRLRVLFCDDIGHCLCFLEHFLPTPPLGYCFLVFKYISVIHLCTIFAKQLWHKSNSVNSASVTDLFIGTNKDQTFCLIWALCKHSAGTWAFRQSRNLGNRANQDTRVLEALWHSKHSRNLDT